LTAITGGEVVI